MTAAAARRIDLNCDLGELPALIADGTQDLLLDRVTSANVACGGHAGDDATMEATLRAALARGVAVGAHPGYPDRDHFGRRPLALPPDDLAGAVQEQVERLASIAERLGTRLRHVKPHGALYNTASRDRAVAAAIARGVAAAVARGIPHGVSHPGGGLILIGAAGSMALQIYAAAGFAVAAEAFADRRYEADGTLRSRHRPGALITDPEEAAEQALAIVLGGAATTPEGTRVPLAADTLCLHGDTPGAPRIAARLAERLRSAGVDVAPLPWPPPI
jgi:5-oxoprolinase (ATP-hydrolysing) subunit A